MRVTRKIKGFANVRGLFCVMAGMKPARRVLAAANCFYRRNIVLIIAKLVAGVVENAGQNSYN